MDQLISKLIFSIFSGSSVGGQAVIAILLIAVGLLVYERRSLISEMSKKDEKLYRIIQDYYGGQKSLKEALDSLKAVLLDIKNKL